MEGWCRRVEEYLEGDLESPANIDVITEPTARFHVSAILTKLGAGNRTKAEAIARQRGLVTG